VLHPAHAWPAAGDREQAFLDEILGLGEIPDDQVSGAQQPRRPVRDELVDSARRRSAWPLAAERMVMSSQRPARL
jgi:hypothetical protein